MDNRRAARGKRSSRLRSKTQFNFGLALAPAAQAKTHLRRLTHLEAESESRFQLTQILACLAPLRRRAERRERRSGHFIVSREEKVIIVHSRAKQPLSPLLSSPLLPFQRSIGRSSGGGGARPFGAFAPAKCPDGRAATGAISTCARRAPFKCACLPASAEAATQTPAPAPAPASNCAAAEPPS